MNESGTLDERDYLLCYNIILFGGRGTRESTLPYGRAVRGWQMAYCLGILLWLLGSVKDGADAIHDGQFFSGE